MKTVNATSFCKQPTCPSSEALLSYDELGTGSELDERIAQHLVDCDFCCAELQLLSECPLANEDDSSAGEIPLPLRRLAEEIFAGSFLTADMFSEAGFEKARLTFTDA